MTHQLQLKMDVTASALMIHLETITAVSRQQQVIFVRTKSYTCVCLPFSGASLVGREEYMVEDSPSFLGSTGLFGRRGKPKGKEKMSRMNISLVFIVYKPF